MSDSQINLGLMSVPSWSQCKGSLITHTALRNQHGGISVWGAQLAEASAAKGLWTELYKWCPLRFAGDQGILKVHLSLSTRLLLVCDCV